MGITPRPRVGVSLCLLGEHCRYDGGTKHLKLLEEVLAPRCELIGVCPEREIGLPVPREKLLLVGPVDAPTVIGEESGTRHGDALRAFAHQWLRSMRGLHGFVLQARSPSCGVGSCLRRPHLEASARRDGTGLFAEVLLATLPDLPVREDTALTDEAACRRFLDEVEDYAARLHSE